MIAAIRIHPSDNVVVLLEQVDAGHRAQEQAHIPIKRHDFGQHLKVVPIVVEKNHAPRAAVE